MTLIKKYSNRRLYHTGESRYVTLEELADIIRQGTEVQVVDAKSGEDLTQVTLTQIVMDSRGAAKLLPATLLAQLIRLHDDALAEFLGKYVSSALDLYLQAQRGAQAISPYFPMSTMPFAASNALVRLMMGGPMGGPMREPMGGPFWGWGGGAAEPEPAPPAPPPEAEKPRSSERDELAALRREIEELKRAVGKR